MVFVLRQLQEKYREQNKDLYATFVDLIKAFDTVSRKGLWQILERLGCPGKISQHGDPTARRPTRPNQTQRRPVRAPPHIQWRVAGLCPGANPLQHLFQHDA